MEKIGQLLLYELRLRKPFVLRQVQKNGILLYLIPTFLHEKINICCNWNS